MKNIALLSAGLAAMLVPLLPATPAQALNQKSFVSSTGSNANPCTRGAPCAGFQAAHNATDPGGEINCLDSGPFTGANISKSITIDCAGTAATVFDGFVVNGADIVVRIRNLKITGGFNTGVGNGIVFQNGAALLVENCVIANFTQSSPFTGIRFTPSASAQLIVTDTVLSNNGNGSTGGGIVVNPASGGTAQVALNRVTVGKNVFGIAADGTGSTGGINVTISDSVISGNSQDGILATTPSSGGAPIGVLVKNTKSINNAGFGIRSIGPNVTIRVSNSTVTGNSTGLSFNFFGTGGALLSFGNNEVQANGANGLIFRHGRAAIDQRRGNSASQPTLPSGERRRLQAAPAPDIGDPVGRC